MAFTVLIAEDAERDLEDIFRYIAQTDAVANAERVLAALEQRCDLLAELPERGNIPKELSSLGITDYREAHFKPYRIIYRIRGREVLVYCILDGRRDMQSLLQRRLLR
jgi:toxin ParE1/3/4